MGCILRERVKLTFGDSQWIPDRELKARLLDAGLFDRSTIGTLLERARAGLLSIKARRVTYSILTAERGCHDNYIIPIATLRGLGSAELDMDKRTLKSGLVRELGSPPKVNFIAFDLEFSRAGTIDYFELPDSGTPKASHSPTFEGKYQPYLEEMHRLITEEGVTQRRASITCAEMDGIHLHTNAAKDSIAVMLRTAYAKSVRK